MPIFLRWIFCLILVSLPDQIRMINPWKWFRPIWCITKRRSGVTGRIWQTLWITHYFIKKRFFFDFSQIIWICISYQGFKNLNIFWWIYYLIRDSILARISMVGDWKYFSFFDFDNIKKIEFWVSFKDLLIFCVGLNG